MKNAIAAALMATTVGSAFAADLPSRKAPVYVEPAPIFTWTGFHVGVNAGATFGGRNTASTVGIPVTNTIPGNAASGPLQTLIATSTTAIVGTGNRTGAILGAQAGYDYQFGPGLLAGVEADIQGIISPNSRGAFSTLVPINNAGIAGTAITSAGFVTKRTDWLGTVRARFGYTFSPMFLLYATGGLAYGGVTSTTGVIATRDNPGALSSGAYGGYSTNRVGYAVGAGAEWMFAPAWSLKAEYLYYDLGSASYNTGLNILNGNGATGFATNINRTRVRYDGHVARLGVNYHFWAPAAAPVVARY